MTPRERVQKAIKHEKCDKVPTDFWATPEVQEKLFDYFKIPKGNDPAIPGIGLSGGPLLNGPDATIDLWDHLGIDGIFQIAPPYSGPDLKMIDGISYSEWGFGSKIQHYREGPYSEQIVWPMSKLNTPEDIESFPWPDPDWYEYDVLPQLVERCRGRAIACGYTAVFYYHNMLRGLELSLMDPVLNPEITRVITAKLSDFFTEYHRRCFESLRGLVDATQVTDDFGSQHGLVISPSVFHEFYRQPMQRAIDLAKSYDIHIMHHDDGDCRPLIPELVEMGIDILNPIQWRCGDWDLGTLKREFGADLCFHSAVDNQRTLPFGTPDEIREQVEMLVDTLFIDETGFILGPCHNLQPNTPVENIVAMYQGAR